MKRFIALVLSPGNRIGTTGFTLGLIAFVISLFRSQYGTALLILIPGIAVSAVGYAHFKSGHAINRRMCVLGLTWSVFALGLCITWGVADTVPSGNSVGATVTCSPGGPSIDAASQQVSLPRQQDITATGPLMVGELTVVAGPKGGTVSCRITIDGKLARIASATGPGATADC
jgi:hypothetical protein